MIRKGDQHIINYFGQALKKWRKARKLSIRELAAIFESDHAMIGKYKQGLTNPTLTCNSYYLIVQNYIFRSDFI